MFWNTKYQPRDERPKEEIAEEVLAIVEKRIGEREKAIAAREASLIEAFNVAIRVTNLAIAKLHDTGETATAALLQREADRAFEAAR